MTLPLLLVLTMLVSVAAGFFRADYGWHNGLLFLLMFILIGLSTFELRRYQGSEAIPYFMPAFLSTAVAVLVCILCGFAGISLGNGHWDFESLVCFAVSLLATGFLSASLSVSNAVRAANGSLLGPTFISLVVYAVALIFGLNAVADDTGEQFITAAAYCVFCIIASFLLIFTASRNARL